jgi:hypothetical protein
MRILTAKAAADGVTVHHEQRTASTRAVLQTKFGAFVAAEYPDTP